MQRYDILNHLVRVHDFQSYLEIGVLGRVTLDSVRVPLRHGVDPNGMGDFTMTSDRFFAGICNRKYDLIFIDGLHLQEQVEKDIKNSLTHLNDNGIIVMHDCLPAEEYYQIRDGLPGKPWTGDVWKAFADLRCNRDDLEMFTIDTDHGCGVIKRGSQIKYKYPEGGWTWDVFKQHRNELMSVITVEEFLNGRS